MKESVAERVRDGLGQAVNELRGGFVVLPGAITLAMALLALTLTNIEERVTVAPAWNDLLDRLFPPEPQAAYVVLGTIAGSMITVVAVVYSVLLVVLTFASTQFSPRVLVSFVEDRVSQTTLGVFVGTFTYCLLTLPAIRSQPRPFVPSVAVILAMIFAVVCLGCLLYFIHHIASSIQASQIVDRIARDTERVVDQLFVHPLARAPIEIEREPVMMGTAVVAPRSGYIRSIDERGLLATARAADLVLCVERYIGQFVIEGTPVLNVSPAERLTVALGAACLRAFNIGPARTMEQDIEFGVLQIVDIALRAISPAVNDPTTALTCIDHLGRILVRAATRQPPPSALCDVDGCPRVILRRTSFPRLLDVAFSQIGHYGKADVAVPLRLLRVLGELAAATQYGPHAMAIRDQARRLVVACDKGFPDADRVELDARLGAVERTVAALADGPEPTSTTRFTAD